MRTHLAILATACAAMLALAATGAAAAAAPPEIKEDGDKLVLQNAHVTIWFQGKKPMLKVFPAGLEDNESAAFTYKLTDVVEYRDVDGDGAASQAEVVSRLNLEKASSYQVERLETEDSVVLNLTLKGLVTLGKPAVLDQDIALPDREAIVSIVFTLHGSAVEAQLAGENVSIPATSVKYDFIVTKWPFVDADAHRLALETVVGGSLALDENLTSEAAAGAATIDANGTAVGLLAWANTAQGVKADGTAVEVPVKTKVAAEGNATRVTHTYDAAGLATLVHDPTVGILPDEAVTETGVDGIGDKLNTVPVPGIALGLAAVGTAAVILRRRL